MPHWLAITVTAAGVLGLALGAWHAWKARRR